MKFTYALNFRRSQFISYLFTIHSQGLLHFTLCSRLELISSDFSCQAVNVLEAVEGDRDGERNALSTMATATNGGADSFSEQTKNTMISAVLRLRKLVVQFRRSRRAVEPEILDVDPLTADDVRIVFKTRFSVTVEPR